MIPRADYIIDHVTEEKVFIIDENGPVSVTNDAEAVVQFEASRYPGRRIIYKDSMEQWDELAHENGEFTGFLPYNGN